MIIKTPISKEEQKEFKKQYSNRKIRTEVFENILQPLYIDSYPELELFLKFQSTLKNDNDSNSLINFLTKSSPALLNKHFGTHDFLFITNKINKIYLLDFENLTLMISTQKEVVLTEKKEIFQQIPQLIKFEQEFNNLLLKLVIHEFGQVPKKIQDNILHLQSTGIITKNNEFNFEYPSVISNLKPKI